MLLWELGWVLWEGAVIQSPALISHPWEPTLDPAEVLRVCAVGQSRAVRAAGHTEAFWWLQPLPSEPTPSSPCRKTASAGLHELWGDYPALHPQPWLSQLTQSMSQPCLYSLPRSFPKMNAPTTLFFFSVIYICFILFAVLLYLGHSLPSVLPSVLSQRTES